MTGWLVNDKLTSIPGTRTFWNNLLDVLPGLVDKTTGSYEGLAEAVEAEAALALPDYIIRNAAYFRPLDVPCPVVPLVQDIIGVFHWKPARDAVLETCRRAAITVFNSEYTRSAYPELADVPYRIIPLGIDELTFRPRVPLSEIPPNAVMWVGSGHSVKGFDLARHLASESQRPWVFVMKDDAPVPEASLVYRRIDHEMLSAIASSCAVGVCTSREETQHLAGIEMGLCGLPLVTTSVGAYFGREPGDWGQVVSTHWHEDIEAAAELDREKIPAYWLNEGFGLESCMVAWRGLVAALEVAHAG